MNYCSFFIEGKCLFGGYPTQCIVDELEAQGVRYFVDLTKQGERKIVPYKTNYEYINFPIKDHRIPHDNLKFSAFIVSLCKIITELGDSKLYLHCKGGHGRSGIVVACILCYLYNLTPTEALRKTTQYHSKRKDMKERRRKEGSPSNIHQKIFVRRFFDPINIPSNMFDIKLESLTEEEIIFEFRRNSEASRKLLDTGLRPIIFQTTKKLDIGKILSEIRYTLYIQK